MIIDIHAHYTSAPPELNAFRGRQVSEMNRPTRGRLRISDEDIEKSLQGHFRQMRERGTDKLIFSPRASGMRHEVGSEFASAMHTSGNRKPFEEVVKHLYFDLAIYDRDSMEMVVRKMGVDNVMFASEMFGTAQPVDPKTGKCFDDTVEWVKGMDWLTEEERGKLFEGNARKLFTRASF